MRRTRENADAKTSNPIAIIYFHAYIWQTSTEGRVLQSMIVAARIEAGMGFNQG